MAVLINTADIAPTYQIDLHIRRTMRQEPYPSICVGDGPEQAEKVSFMQVLSAIINGELFVEFNTKNWVILA